MAFLLNKKKIIDLKWKSDVYGVSPEYTNVQFTAAAVNIFKIP